MKRLSLWFGLGLVPLLLLAFFFPQRFWSGTGVQQGKYERSPRADIVAFVREGCPHCAAFAAFAKERNWTVDYLDIGGSEAQELFTKLQGRVEGLTQGVPVIIIDGKVLQGYETDETTGEPLKRQYDACRESNEGCLSFEAFLEGTDTVTLETAAAGVCTGNCETDFGRFTINLWFVGPVDLTLLSLPVLSVLLGFLDGFNPCAMWVLITLLTLLINTRDMRKVWVIGGTFLFISGAIYYLFIAAWLNVFLLIGLNAFVQKIIGIVAVLGGTFYLYESLSKSPDECKVTDATSRRKTMEKMKKILTITQWPALIIGVSILAISVNMIELICTAGLPAVFTQILAFNSVGAVARYLYILLYIVLYMIDDIVVFAIAVYTLHATGLTKKYSRFTLIFGGVLMYALGLLLIFASEILTFG